MARGFGRDTAERYRLGVVTTPEPGHEDFAGRLAIPSIGIRGVISLRFRCLQSHDCKEEGCPKYLGLYGVETRPFNTRALHQASEVIGITEGELDAITLEQCDIPAVGIPSANAWKDHYPRLFAGYNRVYIFGDGDKAGREFNERVGKSLANAIVVTMGQGDDVNDVYCTKGPSGVRQLLE